MKTFEVLKYPKGYYEYKFIKTKNIVANHCDNRIDNSPSIKFYACNIIGKELLV